MSNRTEPGGRADGAAAPDRAAECEVSLYMRASPTGVGKRRQERVEDRLVALAEAERIGSLSVDHWPSQLRVGPDEAPAMAERYDDLAATAEAAGATLTPFFDDHESVDGVLQGSGESRVITFPVIGVVVEDGGDPVGLYPCHRDGKHHRVEDAVDALAAGDAPTNLR